VSVPDELTADDLRSLSGMLASAGMADFVVDSSPRRLLGIVHALVRRVVDADRLTMEERMALNDRLARVGSFDVGDATPRRLSEIIGMLVETMVDGGLGEDVDDEVAASTEPATDEDLHARQSHPDFEYATTTGPRKAFDEHPPDGDGWVRNKTRGVRGEGWERFDFHEEAYWMRRRQQGRRP